MRLCNKCNTTMVPINSVQNDKSAIPWDTKQTIFKCENCDTEAIITNNISIFTNIVSGIFIFILLSYFLFTGLFDFTLYLFSQSFLSILGGIILTILIIVFLLGSLFTISSGIKQLKVNKTFPCIDDKSDNHDNSNEIKLALFLGALPIILSLLLGMVDFYFYELNEILVMFLLPIVFSPIILARKFNSSIIKVFYGTFFWIFILIIGFYLNK